MYTLPQETTALKAFDFSKILAQIEGSLGRGDDGVVPLSLEQGVIPGCYIVTPKNKSIPVFHLPLLIDSNVADNPNRSSSNVNVVIDMRAHMRESRYEEIVSNQNEFNFNVGLMRLVKLWLNGEMAVVNNFAMDPLMRVWVRWVGTNLITRFNILESSQPNVNIITAWYFYCLNNPDSDNILDASKLTRISTLISRATFTNPTLVSDILKEVPRLNNLDDYVQALKEHSGTDRFGSLTNGFLFSLLQYSWYGSSAVQLTSASLECPPLFVAMCWGSLRYDAFRRTPIGKLTKELRSTDQDAIIMTIDKIFT